MPSGVEDHKRTDKMSMKEILDVDVDDVASWLRMLPATKEANLKPEEIEIELKRST